MLAFTLALRELILKEKLNTNQKDNGFLEVHISLLILAWHLVGALKADRHINVHRTCHSVDQMDSHGTGFPDILGKKYGPCHLAGQWELDTFLQQVRFLFGEWRLGSDPLSIIGGTKEDISCLIDVHLLIFSSMWQKGANIPCPIWDLYPGRTFLAS